MRIKAILAGATAASAIVAVTDADAGESREAEKVARGARAPGGRASWSVIFS